MHLTVKRSRCERTCKVEVMEDTNSEISTVEEGTTLLLVDDDGPFVRRLGRAMESRGFTVDIAETVADGLAKASTTPPDYAVIDMRLGDGNGLDVIEAIRKAREDTRMIVLTGYGNIATAVNAVKLGAIDLRKKDR